MAAKTTMRLLRSCGFTQRNEVAITTVFCLTNAFEIPYFGHKNRFYITNPGKWPLSPYPWDAPGREMEPARLHAYLTTLVAAAENLGLSAQHVGAALALYGSHTAAVTTGRADEMLYTFDICLQIAAAIPAAVPTVATFFARGIPWDVIVQVLRGEQNLDLMLRVYDRHEPAAAWEW